MSQSIISSLESLIEQQKQLLEKVTKLEQGLEAVFNYRERMLSLIERNPHRSFSFLKEEEKKDIVDFICALITRKGHKLVISDSELFEMMEKAQSYGHAQMWKGELKKEGELTTLSSSVETMSITPPPLQS
jgi:hypothetical protein